MTSLCQSRYTQKFLKAHFFDHEPQIRSQAQHPSEKYIQIGKIQLTGKRKFHRGTISPSGVNKIRLIKPKQALNMSIHHPFFISVVFS